MRLINILEENEDLPFIEDNINLENILNFDFRKLLSFDLNRDYKDNDISKGLEKSFISKCDNATFLGRKRKINFEENNSVDKKQILRDSIISR